MKKHTKEYAEKLAKDFAKKTIPGKGFDMERRHYAHDFKAGYLKAIKENAVPELIREVERYLPILKKLQDKSPAKWCEITEGTGIATINGLEAALKKATS